MELSIRLAKKVLGDDNSVASLRSWLLKYVKCNKVYRYSPTTYKKYSFTCKRLVHVWDLEDALAIANSRVTSTNTLVYRGAQRMVREINMIKDNWSEVFYDKPTQLKRPRFSYQNFYGSKLEEKKARQREFVKRFKGVWDD